MCHASKNSINTPRDGHPFPRAGGEKATRPRGGGKARPSGGRLPSPRLHRHLKAGKGATTVGRMRTRRRRGVELDQPPAHPATKKRGGAGEATPTCRLRPRPPTQGRGRGGEATLHAACDPHVLPPPLFYARRRRSGPYHRLANVPVMPLSQLIQSLRLVEACRTGTPASQ